MTALRREAIQLVEQMPEEQMAYIIQYIRSLNGATQDITVAPDNEKITPRMHAFIELEEMLVPVLQDIDYDRELAEARKEMKEYLGRDTINGLQDYRA